MSTFNKSRDNQPGGRVQYERPQQYDQPGRYQPQISNPRAPYSYKPDTDSIKKAFQIVSGGDIGEINNIISSLNVPYNVTNETGQTLVHIVLLNNLIDEDQKYNIISHLLAKGAPAMGYDINNITPMHIASKNQYKSIIELLIKNKAPVNVYDSNRMSPLHYLAQGTIVECKRPKKVGDLIPSEPGRVDESSLIVLKEMTVNIIDMLKEPAFMNYIEHLKVLFGLSHLMFADEFDGLKAVFIRDVHGVLKDLGKSGNDKKKSIGDLTLKLQGELNRVVEGRAGDGLANMDIGGDNADGWKPVDFKGPNVLPVDVTAKFVENYERDRIREIDELDGLIHANIEAFENTAGLLDKSADEIHKHIYYIIQYSLCAYLNRTVTCYDIGHIDCAIDIGDPALDNFSFKFTNVDDTADHAANVINTFVLYTDNYNNVVTDMFDNYEMNLIDKNFFLYKHSGLLNPDDDGGFNFNNLPNEYHFTKRNQKKQKNLRDLPLTNDSTFIDPADGTHHTNHTFYVDPTMKDPTLHIYFYHYNPVTQINGTNQVFYYTSKLEFAIKRIYKLQSNLDFNLKEIKFLMGKKKYYHAFSNIIISSQELCFNIFQNILLGKKELPYVTKKTMILKNKLVEKFKQFENHPYSFLLEKCDIFCDIILEHLKSIATKFNDMYNNIYGTYQMLNTIINLINKQSAYKYIYSFIHKDFIEHDTDTYLDIFLTNISNLRMPPENIMKYEDEFGKLDLQYMRQSYYEKYAYFIHGNKYLEYYADIENIPDDFEPDDPNNQRIFYLSYGLDDNTDLEKIPYNKLERDPFHIDNYIFGKSVVGILYAPILYIHEDGRESEYLGGDRRVNQDYIKSPNILPLNKKGYENKGKVYSTDATDDLRGKISVKKIDYNYNITSGDSIVLTINNYLNIHLYNVKYIIIKELLTRMYNNATNIPNNQIGQKTQDLYIEYIRILNSHHTLPPEHTNSIYLSTVAKIADNLLNIQMKSYIIHAVNTYVKIALNQTHTSTIIDRPILNPPSNFQVKLSHMYDDIIVYESHLSSNMMIHAMRLVEHENDQMPDQYIIYDQNYTALNSNVQNQCLATKSDAIELLMDNGIDVNQKDTTGSTPIFYAIQTLNTVMIKKLIDRSGVSNPKIANQYGVTPYASFIDIYRNHMGPPDDTIIKLIGKFTDPLYSNAKKVIESNAEYGNNIIRYMDIIFPQILIMYNNLLFAYAKSYVGKWTYQDAKDLENLLKTNGLSTMPNISILCSNAYKTAADGSIRGSIITDREMHIKKEIDTYGDKNNDIDHILNNLTSEREDLLKPGYLPDPNVKINNIVNIITILTNLTQINSETTSNLVRKKQNMESRKNRVENINNAILTRNTPVILDMPEYLGEYSPESNILTKGISHMYDMIFKKTTHRNIKKNFKYFDHMLYNNLWKMALADPDCLNSSYNIHLATSILQNKILASDPKTHQPDYELLQKLNNNVFVPTIINTINAPQYYDPKRNYGLTEQMDIIIHVVKHVILANMFYAILKTIIEYLLASHSSSDAKRPDTYDNINEIIKHLANTEDTPDRSELYTYIIDKMPKTIVKMKLKTYASKTDENTEITSDDDMFKHITTILIKELNITPNSILITNLERYIFPYYRTILNEIIPKTMVLINNYNRFILNSARFLDIMVMMNKKAIDEDKARR